MEGLGVYKKQEGNELELVGWVGFGRASSTLGVFCEKEHYKQYIENYSKNGYLYTKLDSSQ